MEQTAVEFVRALRGGRSQKQWARRLGYRGNPITDWECGRRFPTATELLRAATLSGVEVGEAFARFAPTAPLLGPANPEQLAAWLSKLRGSTPLKELAERVGHSRFALSRWLKGEAQPRLPDFFRLLDATTGRLPDWVAEFVPIAQVPSLERRFQAAAAAKRLAFEMPWSEAVLSLLGTDTYRRLPRHKPGWLARALGIDLEQKKLYLERLEGAALIERRSRRYVVIDRGTVDTKGGKKALHLLKKHWSTVAAQRLDDASERDFFAYNVMSLSRSDLAQVLELLRDTFREIRSLVAASQPEEVAALVNLQLVLFDPEQV